MLSGKNLDFERLLLRSWSCCLLKYTKKSQNSFMYNSSTSRGVQRQNVANAKYADEMNSSNVTDWPPPDLNVKGPYRGPVLDER
jgi:hypothetical protein